MIDQDGYRANVGMILVNAQGNVLWARRVGGQDTWQFPQGGVHQGESTEQALYRELDEEVGLQASDVNVLACTRSWLRYRLPERYQRSRQDGRVCVGQKQKWFLLQMQADDSAVSLNSCDTEAAEFDHWQWVSYWYPVDKVVSFKREVYRKALNELSHHQQRLLV